MAIPLARPTPAALTPPAVSRHSWSQWMQRTLGQDWATAYVFAAPMLLLLVGLIGWPMARALWMSLHQVIGPRWVGFVGLGNYTAMIQDPIFRRSLGITIQFTGEAVAIKFVIGLVASLALHNVPRYRGILTALILAPYVVPEVVTAAIFRLLYDPVFGGLNITIKSLYGTTGDLIGTARG